jgi:predicted SnoaL-like aldol condensation-catalyzing enzyme
MKNTTMNKKEIAVSFLHLASSGKVREAYEKYVHPDFRHHNPYFKGDRESLLVAMEENALKNPNKFLEVQHVFEDGNLIAVHSRVQLKKDDSGIAVVHIFRFEGDRIVELWDVGQQVPKDSPNENGMF